MSIFTTGLIQSVKPCFYTDVKSPVCPMSSRYSNQNQNRYMYKKWFAMHDAARYGDLKTVTQLIEEGMSVDSRDDRERTPLHVAAKRGAYNVVQLLISSMCDINALDYDGSTPVMHAAFSKEKEVTDLLLRHGAEVDRVDHGGSSLLHLASYNGWADTVQHILSIEEEVDLNAVTGMGKTPLMEAASVYTGLEDCADILLRAGADPNQRGGFNLTALHYAVLNGRTRVVRLLLGVEGLDLNPQDVNGWTPLHLACNKEGCREVLTMLLKAGADYAIKDNDGVTAVCFGIWKMNLEDIWLFVQQGLFFQEMEYARLLKNSILKESVLKDVSLCTQSVVNKFHRQTLPALKSISYFAEQLPNIDKFKLNAREIDEVEELVQCEIGRNNFCNVLKVHPMSLKALCILTLITY